MTSIMKQVQIFTKIDTPIYIVPIISGILFLYESLYIRIISAVLFNNYVFLIISLSVIGYGLGSVIYHNLSEKDKIQNFIKNRNNFILYLSTLFITVFSMLALIYFVPYLNYWLYLIPVSIPFIMAGFLFSLLYDNFNRKSGFIYALDLIGAVIGLTGGLFLMNNIGVIQTALLLGVSAALTMTFYLIKIKKIIIIIPISAAIFLLFVLVNANTLSWVNKNFNSLYTSPSTSLARFSQAGQEADIIATKWDAFSRTDVIDLGAQQRERVVTIDGAANASMVKNESDSQDLQFLKTSIDYLPYILRTPEKVAIIGAGGGRDVQQALIGGAEYIDAIEINKSSIDLTKEMKDYNGSLYFDKRVNIQETDGRSFIQHSKVDYDLIFLSLVMTGTSQAEGLVTAETFIYTKEAISTYIEKLSPNGQLTFVSHDIREMTKLLKTISEILLESGYSEEDLKNHLIVTGNPKQHGKEVMLHEPVITFSPTAFTSTELKSAKSFFKKLNIIPVIMNGETDIEIFLSIIKGQEQDLPFNYQPATDEKPYFYQFSKGLPGSLSTILIISLLIPLFLWGSKIMQNRIMGMSVYFSLSGLAFMMVEVVLIQKMTLILGHSIIAFTFVISIILSGAGIGGIISTKGYENLKKYAGIIASIIILAGALLLQILADELLSTKLIPKMLIIGPFLLISSVFQGMIFPTAIKKMKKFIPVYYGINSSFSLIGSVSALVLIFLIGSTNALIVSSLLYFTIFIIRPFTLDKI